MGSLGFGEIAVIAVVALIVFGPDRLPELFNKAGELLAKAREATRTFTEAIDSEFDEISGPLKSLNAEVQATKKELSSAAGTVLALDGIDDPPPSGVASVPSSGVFGTEMPGEDSPQEAEPDEVVAEVVEADEVAPEEGDSP